MCWQQQISCSYCGKRLWLKYCGNLIIFDTYASRNNDRRCRRWHSTVHSVRGAWRRASIARTYTLICKDTTFLFNFQISLDIFCRNACFLVLYLLFSGFLLSVNYRIHALPFQKIPCFIPHAEMLRSIGILNASSR